MSSNFTNHSSADDAALELIDFQPQMFMGVERQEKPMSTSSRIADSSAPSANHTIIRVGLIGVGNWALNGPVRVFRLMPQYEMAAVYSQRRDAAQAAADTFGIRHVVGSIDELVRHPDVDIVLVLTTGPQHEEAVRAAIAAGKTVYCEWPLTRSEEHTS